MKQDMNDRQPRLPFLFLHGGWHDLHTWDGIVARLQALGIVAEAIDLPGSGVHASLPASLRQRPLDLEAVRSERSPSSDVTQDERTQAVLRKLEEIALQTHQKAVLVGHSLGGVTVTAVGEARPDLVAAVVYLSASLVAPGKTVFEINSHPAAAAAQARGAHLALADPLAVGAIRLDVASDDPAYRATVRDIFFGDLSDEQFADALIHMYPDEPLRVFAEPSVMTPERFGGLPRHYIYTTEDRSVPFATQQFMVDQTDAAMENPTVTHALTSSHSPFYSQPDALTALLVSIVDSL